MRTNKTKTTNVDEAKPRAHLTPNVSVDLTVEKHTKIVFFGFETEGTNNIVITVYEIILNTLLLYSMLIILVTRTNMKFKRDMMFEFEISDIGIISYFMGMEFKNKPKKIRVLA